LPRGATPSGSGALLRVCVEPDALIDGYCAAPALDRELDRVRHHV
jgi:hypothetical protein